MFALSQLKSRNHFELIQAYFHLFLEVRVPFAEITFLRTECIMQCTMIFRDIFYLLANVCLNEIKYLDAIFRETLVDVDSAGYTNILLNYYYSRYTGM